MPSLQFMTSSLEFMLRPDKVSIKYCIPLFAPDQRIVKPAQEGNVACVDRDKRNRNPKIAA
jgi:hypothetical protein